jgi:hypothetical protein
VGVDLFKSFLSDVLRVAWQFLRSQKLRLNPVRQYFFIVGAVEDADPALCGQTFRGAPKEVVIQFLRRGSFEPKHLATESICPDITCLMALSLPAASMAWKINNSARRSSA